MPPSFYTVMQPPGGPKYLRVKNEHGKDVRPTQGILDAHWRGELTASTCLADAHGMTMLLGFDIDSGGKVAVDRLLHACAYLGLQAFSQAHDTPEGHSGGWIYVLFISGVPVERADALADRVLVVAEMHRKDEDRPDGVEVRPNGNLETRLPFGVHRYTGKRGTYTDTTGLCADLDTPEGRAEVWAACQSLANDPEVCPEVERPDPRQVFRERPQASLPDQIRRANDMSRDEFADLVADYPGYRRARGSMLHCGCPHHKNGDSTPSLQIIDGRSGKPILRAYSPACIWADGRKCYDPVAFVAAMEGIRQGEAAARILNEEVVAPLSRRERDTERKQDARQRARQHAEELRAALHAHIAEDRDPWLMRRPSAKLVVAELLRTSYVYKNQLVSCPAVAHLAVAAGIKERATQNVLHDLEHRGYFTTTPRGRHDTPLRTFSNVPDIGVTTPQNAISGVQSTERPAAADADIYDGAPGTHQEEAGRDCRDAADCTLIYESLLEGRVGALVSDPHEWETYELDFDDDTHSPDELNLLDADVAQADVPLPSQAIEPVPGTAPAYLTEAVDVLDVREQSYDGACFDPALAGQFPVPRRPAGVPQEDWQRSLYSVWCAAHAQGSPLPEPAPTTEPTTEQVALRLDAPDEQPVASPAFDVRAWLQRNRELDRLEHGRHEQQMVPADAPAQDAEEQLVVAVGKPAKREPQPSMMAAAPTLLPEQPLPVPQAEDELDGGQDAEARFQPIASGVQPDAAGARGPDPGRSRPMAGLGRGKRRCPKPATTGPSVAPVGGAPIKARVA